jgi:hypothetical protein
MMERRRRRSSGAYPNIHKDIDEAAIEGRGG